MPLKTPSISFQNHKINEVDSTNLELSRRLQNACLEEGYLLRADFQDDGKGQGNALWESEKGQNLLFSFVLKPNVLKISEQFYITIVVSLALADVVRNFVDGNQVKIKWPNDIYVSNKKIAGVLIENAIRGDEFEWVVIGVGMNINQGNFESDAPNPVSLFELLEEDIELDKVLSIFESQFARRYAQLQSGDYEGLKYDYLASLYQYKEWKNYRSNNQEFRGRIIGIDQYGFLRMETPDGERSFDIKEVKYL